MKKRSCGRNFRLVKAWEGYKQRECLKEMIEFFLVDSYFMYYLVTKALSKNVNNAWLAPFGTLSHVGAQYKKKKKKVG